MRNKFAFSLIEISVVLLIIGILVAGSMQGSRLVKKSRLSSAQSLTENSIVNNLDDLVLWYETSLPSSFVKDEAYDGENISLWFDRNPQALTRNNAIQNISSSQPKFFDSVFFGALPAIRFDGLNDFMTFDGSSLINNSYTIFVVEQRRVANSGYLPFIGGTTLSSNNNLILGYFDNTTIIQSHYDNHLTYSIPSFSSPTPKIHSFFFNNSDGKKYWINGGITPNASASGQTTALSTFEGAAIGRYDNYYFNGDLAEIIIFKHSLKTEERQAVENYLSKKYGIAIN